MVYTDCDYLGFSIIQYSFLALRWLMQTTRITQSIQGVGTVLGTVHSYGLLPVPIKPRFIVRLAQIVMFSYPTFYEVRKKIQKKIDV